MTRYHYREGATIDKKKRHWGVILFCTALLIGGAYVGAIYLAPQLIIVPFTSLTQDATNQKMSSTKPGALGDHIFLPQINIDTAITSDSGASDGSVWRQHTELGDPSSGNFVLSGVKFTLDLTPMDARKRSPFYNLDKLKQGDDITIDYKSKRYVYRIQSMANGAKSLTTQKTSEPCLTLFDTDSSGQSVGAVVRAKRISPAVQTGSYSD